jgi:hypothetical protein
MCVRNVRPTGELVHSCRCELDRGGGIVDAEAAKAARGVESAFARERIEVLAVTKRRNEMKVTH